MIRHLLRRHIALTVVLLACSTACDSTTGPTPAGAELRIINVGSRPLESLVVLFPGARIGFGDIAPGVTSPYRPAPGGVFRYAAYEFRTNGRIQLQPVIDWVGEEPMEGRAFTYSVELEDAPGSGVRIRLVSTRRDF